MDSTQHSSVKTVFNHIERTEDRFRHNGSSATARVDVRTSTIIWAGKPYTIQATDEYPHRIEPGPCEAVAALEVVDTGI